MNEKYIEEYYQKLVEEEWTTIEKIKQLIKEDLITINRDQLVMLGVLMAHIDKILNAVEKLKWMNKRGGPAILKLPKSIEKIFDEVDMKYMQEWNTVKSQKFLDNIPLDPILAEKQLLEHFPYLKGSLNAIEKLKI